MSGIEKNLARQAMRSGNPLPDRIKNAPSLTMGLDFFLNAFFDLESERIVSGMGGINQIPWSKIQKYAEVYKLDEDQAEMLHFHIKRLDSAQLSRILKAEAKNAKGKKP